VLDQLNAAKRAKDEAKILAAVADLDRMEMNLETGVNGHVSYRSSRPPSVLLLLFFIKRLGLLIRI
jgi:hypothetical protein